MGKQEQWESSNSATFRTLIRIYPREACTRESFFSNLVESELPRCLVKSFDRKLC